MVSGGTAVQKSEIKSTVPYNSLNLEVTKTPDDKHQVVFAFLIDTKTYKKVKDISGRSDGPSLHVSAVESEFATARNTSVPFGVVQDSTKTISPNAYLQK